MIKQMISRKYIIILIFTSFCMASCIDNDNRNNEDHPHESDYTRDAPTYNAVSDSIDREEEKP